ncbi:hypothetical protein ACRS6Y_20195 [Bacillus cytotoxicus]|uniref:Group-specific protein n=1 Tax=Bacillus cytotoxicus TaxID=580165 RepID=A0AAX2CIG8_9BACI|nr:MULTISPECIES: hypothetical protein [Bacillus cereus group]AWC37276.1 hypothetical protein CG481_013285 [Bacillus cytotoxicus]AWC61543.1 hypothetical protein CG474_013345 [Bacillus cytotoxicus]KMT49780.1 hypothetical protein TU51_12540 [Bacillus cytotoxicus]QTR69741.1 hypothetical protein JC775_12620 [Bacillus cytotoxicus]QTR81657.1 hypothetical protein JC777_13770 [Bacillus cytotoxicus]
MKTEIDLQNIDTAIQALLEIKKEYMKVKGFNKEAKYYKYNMLESNIHLIINHFDKSRKLWNCKYGKHEPYFGNLLKRFSNLENLNHYIKEMKLLRERGG